MALKGEIKDTHREKEPSNKTLPLKKVQTWAFRLLVQQISSLLFKLFKVLKLKKNFQKIK